MPKSPATHSARTAPTADIRLAPWIAAGVDGASVGSGAVDYAEAEGVEGDVVGDGLGDGDVVGDGLGDGDVVGDGLVEGDVVGDGVERTLDG
jgi:hypothetical protein